MSTNSRLRAVLPTGEALKPIYCRWDGYPSNMMPLLTTYYNTTEKVKELMALGDLSYLKKRVNPILMKNIVSNILQKMLR